MTEFRSASASSSFDRLARLAADVLHVPFVVVAVIEGDREVVLSSVGVDPTGNTLGPRESLCRDVVARGKPIVLHDALAELDRTEASPLRDRGLSAFLGVPLRSAAGEPVGCFSVIDASAREWTEREHRLLEQMAEHASVALELELEVAERAKAESLAMGQSRVLELVAGGTSLQEVLRATVDFVEQNLHGALGSVLLLEEGTTLRTASAPSLPAEYCAAIDGAQIGPNTGSCGTAAYTRVLTVVEDIATDRRWRDYAALAGRFDLRACWSTPIISGDRVLGTFAVYYRTPRAPLPEELTLIEMASRLARIAIEREETHRLMERSETVRRTALAAAQLGTWRVDLELGTDTRDAEMNRMFGLPPMETVTSIEESHARMHPDDMPVIRRAIEATMAHGVPYDVEHRIIRADGVVRWMRNRGRAIPRPGGPPRYVTGAIADITLEREAQFALRASEARFRGVVETAHEGVWVTTASGETTYANARMGAMLGVDSAALPGRSIFDFMDPGGAFEARTLYARRFRGISEMHETAFVRPDGQVLWSLVSMSPLLDEQGDLTGVLAMVTDITERKRGEDQLAKALGTLETLIEHAPLGVYALDRDLQITEWNASAERMFGYARHEVLGQPLTMLAATGQEAALRAELLEELASGVGVQNVEGTLRRKDGQMVEVLLYSAILQDEAGQPSRIVRFAVDLRERKLLEEQLRQSQKMEAVGRLAGGVAHDFNNLLTVIRVHSELLLEHGQLDVPVREDIEEIRNAANRASGLTRQLLAFSRKQILKPRAIDANVVIVELQRMLSRLLGVDVKLDTALSRDLAPVMVDPGQLEQVLMNLMVNARDAMPQGGTLRVVTRNERIGEQVLRHNVLVAPGDYVRIDVSDTGLGMDPSTIARVFEPFFTTKAAGHGTGLGLSTVYGIVKQSGGYVFVESEVGQGARFTVLLPRAEAEPPRHETPHAAMPAIASKGTILLVEDEPAVRTLARRILVRQGFEVIETANGREALDVARDRAGTIDLVLTDAMMPEMSGPELVERLEQILPDSRILFMSGYTDDDMVRRGARQEGFAFLQKPFTPAELVAAVLAATSAAPAR
ncbi:MAG: Blue-light-activated protein [Gemmatimonadetes bacterium]|nr:Blue-light-activated protein [Gemmatimonadota bacterium]